MSESEKINSDVQQLEPGELIELWTLDASEQGGGVVYFQGRNDGVVSFQGIEYNPWPIKGRGFERTSAQQPIPSVQVGNVEGSISQLCLLYEDLVGAVLTRRRTFAKYLDGADEADPEAEFTPEVWYVERKSVETAEMVEFELSSALDFMGQKLPRRQIIANQCPWKYRGEGCAYIGPPVATVFDTPTSDPALDRCGKRLQSCEMRLWPDGILNFGGFLAAGLMRT